jgi:hypothetical protein
MVDATLYFEGDRGHQFRILRAVKNRFGATDEIGVFEMTDRGLMEVPNPSALFLAERRGNISGSAVFAGMEGTRPVLVEVQALLSPSSGGSPRRQVVGWDSGRLSMLLAVLETRCGLTLGQNDVYLNIAGGLRVNEPAADLAVAAALVSAAADRPTDAGAIYFGEVGLSGEVRQVAQADPRLREAAKLGFCGAILPRRLARGRAAAPAAPDGLRLTEIGHLADLVAALDQFVSQLHGLEIGPANLRVCRTAGAVRLKDVLESFRQAHLALDGLRTSAAAPANAGGIATGPARRTPAVLAHRLQFANPGVDRSPAHAQGPCDIGDTAETDLQRFDTSIATPMVLRQ